MSFPATRMRRLRASGAVRALVRETELRPGHLVLPLFVDATIEAPRDIPTMPKVRRLPVADAVAAAVRAHRAGADIVITYHAEEAARWLSS